MNYDTPIGINFPKKGFGGKMVDTVFQYFLKDW